MGRASAGMFRKLHVPDFTTPPRRPSLKTMRSVLLIAAFLGVTLQDPAGPGDSSRIEFFYAGRFKEALKKASDENRMLLVKGVSVILDEDAAGDIKRGTC